MRRYFWTVLGAAVLIVLVYLFVAFIVDGYLGGDIYPDEWVPDSWAAPDSWEEWRDIVIVITGAFWIFAGMVMIVLLVALVYLVFMIRNIMRDSVGPAVDSLKTSLDTVAGTTEYVGETVVSPIVRVYSIFRGVRSGIGAVGGIGDRVRGRKSKKKR